MADDVKPTPVPGPVSPPVPPPVPPAPPPGPPKPAPVPPPVVVVVEPTPSIDAVATAVGTEAADLVAAAQKEAAEVLAVSLREGGGVIAELVHGNTVEEVKSAWALAQKAYAAVRGDVLRELGAAVPAGHGSAAPAPPPPADPFDKIALGLRASDQGPVTRDR